MKLGDRSEHLVGYPTLPYGVIVEGRGEVGGRSEHWVGYPTVPYLTLTYPKEFKWAIKLIKK